MKSIRKVEFLLVIVAIIFATSSCKKYLKEEINDDPTSLDYAEPYVILPAAQANLAYYYGGDLARYTGIMTQQTYGAGNQWTAYQLYNFVDADFDNIWNSFYGDDLLPLSKMLEYAKTNNMHHYRGVGTILSAFIYATMVDHWNDIPFSEALQGQDKLQPKFDNAATVYASLHDMIADGTALLGKTDEGKVPGSDDLFFGGDLDKWVNFGHAVRARMYLHTKDYANAQTQLNMANGVDAYMQFNSPGSGPMVQFDDNRYGDLTYMESNLFTTLSGLGDIRAYSYADTNYNSLGSYLYRPDQPIWFISAIEQKFMQAELEARAGSANAQTTLMDAIQMSYDEVTGGDTTGFASVWAAYPYNDADPLAKRLESVITHKYFAMYLQAETFADWRRTGYPSLTPNTGSDIPRRFLYPTDEKNTNPNTPAGITLFQKVFWDN